MGEYIVEIHLGIIFEAEDWEEAEKRAGQVTEMVGIETPRRQLAPPWVDFTSLDLTWKLYGPSGF
ncbi:MAG: hypothetical protein OXN15_00485 [Chloroflexota bacterium]|nr:hypothetical protein [Chloroflexota bacterium]